MAGRHPRDWEKKTYTLSPWVARTIAIRAVDEGLDPGTVVDTLIWNVLLNPTDEELKPGRYTNDQLERIFAEEVLAFLDTDEKIRELSTHLSLGGEDFDEELDLHQTRRLVKKWRTTRRIEKERQEELLAAFVPMGFHPRIHAAVDSASWFLRD